MFSPDFEDTTFSAKTDERESAFDLPAKPPKMPKGKKKRKRHGSTHSATATSCSCKLAASGARMNCSVT